MHLAAVLLIQFDRLLRCQENEAKVLIDQAQQRTVAFIFRLFDSFAGERALRRDMLDKNSLAPAISGLCFHGKLGIPPVPQIIYVRKLFIFQV